MTANVPTTAAYGDPYKAIAAAVMYANGSQYPVWVAVCPVTGEIVVYNREA